MRITLLIVALLACTGMMALRAHAAPSTLPAVPAKPQWILITAPALKDALDPLKKQRADQGFEVTALVTTDILSPEELAAGNGQKLKDRIDQLAAPAPAQTYVLLVGIPNAAKDAASISLPALIGTTGRMKDHPTDNPYGRPEKNLVPTLAVGRFPARTRQEAADMVAKTLAFERAAPTAPWRRRVTLLVGDPGGQSRAEIALGNWIVSTSLKSMMDRMNPLWTPAAIVHVPTSAWFVPDAQLTAAARTRLEAGQLCSVYAGHSAPDRMASGNVSFMTATDWQNLKAPGRAGIFMTCGCWGAQFQPANALRPGDGYAIAAVRNPAGPVAAIAATDESYSMAGQLAFEGLVGDFAKPDLPERLGDAFLHVKTALAHGRMDGLTFMMFDYGDGSQGTIPLETKRKEHIEMWMLLGDPALKLPAVAPEIALDAPASAAPGDTITLHGKIPAAFAQAPVRISLERPFSTPALPAAATQPAHSDQANNPTLSTQEVQPQGGQFTATLQLPAAPTWPRIVIRVETGQDTATAVGVAVIKVVPKE